MEPAVFLATFLSLAALQSSIDRACTWVPESQTGWRLACSVFASPGDGISDVDWGLMLLVLALTFPAPDLLSANRWQRVGATVSHTALLALVLALCAWATRGLQSMNISLWGYWLLVAPVTHVLSITLLGRLLKQRANGQYAARAVVVGTGPMGIRTARALRRLHVGQPHHFLGWINLEDASRATASRRPPHRDKPLRLGGLKALEHLLRAGLVDEVYLTGPLESGLSGTTVAPGLGNLWSLLSDSTVTVRWVPDVMQAVILQGQVTTLEGLPMIGLLETPYGGIRAATKRLSDLAWAATALLLAAPLMLLIAVAIRTETPGPAIFRQRRLGMNGKVIEVWKFRTMSVMEDGPDIVQATRSDPRITPLGRFLRRSSLDELPQFINVLQGRMSVVGPRPHALAHNDLYRGQVLAYMIRHKVRPGITGWAQVNGFRGETDTIDKMRNRVEHDLYYLQNWSLSFDFQIILRTVGLVFLDRKAW